MCGGGGGGGGGCVLKKCVASDVDRFDFKRELYCCCFIIIVAQYL